MTLGLDSARIIISSALAHGRSVQMKPMCVAVLDAGGYLIAFEREDGSANRRFDIAHAK
ncbi:MAG: heme-binding protein, partial [Ilumatobacteraceae bacterium]